MKNDLLLKRNRVCAVTNAGNRGVRNSAGAIGLYDGIVGHVIEETSAVPETPTTYLPSGVMARPSLEVSAPHEANGIVTRLSANELVAAKAVATVVTSRADFMNGWYIT